MLFPVLFVLMFALSADAQEASVRIEVRSGATPVAGASVIINGIPRITNEQGVVALTLPAGTVEIVVTKEGFPPATASVAVGAGESRTISFELASPSTIEEHVTVSATRTDTRLEHQ